MEEATKMRNVVPICGLLADLVNSTRIGSVILLRLVVLLLSEGTVPHRFLLSIKVPIIDVAMVPIVPRCTETDMVFTAVRIYVHKPVTVHDSTVTVPLVLTTAVAILHSI